MKTTPFLKRKVRFVLQIGLKRQMRFIRPRLRLRLRRPLRLQVLPGGDNFVPFVFVSDIN
jgi:hypothetical protein